MYYTTQSTPNTHTVHNLTTQHYRCVPTSCEALICGRRATRRGAAFFLATNLATPTFPVSYMACMRADMAVLAPCVSERGGVWAHRLDLTHLISRCRHHHLDRGPHCLVGADTSLGGEAQDSQAALRGHLHLSLIAVCDGHQALAIAITWEQRVRDNSSSFTHRGEGYLWQCCRSPLVSHPHH